MSLLNQVLQDLQDRQAPDANTAQATLRDVRVPIRGGARAARRPWVLWTAIVILAGVSGNLLWQRGQQVTATPAVTPTRGGADTQRAASITRRRLAPVTAASRHSERADPRTGRCAHGSTRTDTHDHDGHSADCYCAAAAADHAPAPQPTPAPHAQTLCPRRSHRRPVRLPMPIQRHPLSSRKITQQRSHRPSANPRLRHTSASVEKTARPLSAEQQAELAYQDALRLLQSGRPSAAEPRLHAALDSYPAHRAARTTLAGLLINAGRLPEATTVLAAGLALAPTYAPFAKLYARLRIDQGESGDARAVLERAAPAVQDDPEYHALLAALYQRLGLYEQAAQTYRGALQAQPRNGVWWLGLGLALEGTGDRSNALQAYQRAQQSGTLDSEVLRYVESKITALQ